MANLLLAIIYLAFISLGLPDGLLGAAWPSMYPQFHVSVDLAGYVSMVISAGTIISALLSDRATLRFGAGKVTAASVTLTMIALFGFSFSTQYWMLLLWAIPYGLGAGGVDAALNNYVALAISLLDKPELLILDEPTVGIDPVLSHQIWQELRIMRDNGTTILITTHIMAEAELTNRVALLRNGKIIADDTPANLKTQYHADSIEQVFMKAEEN